MSITLKDLEAATWFKTPATKFCVIGNVNLYQFLDGHCSAAENNVWISALFTSLEAAVSWSGDWDAAELAFKALNPPTGKGENYLPPKHKKEDPMNEAHDLLKQCLEAFRAIPVATNSRKMLKKLGVQAGAYAGNGSHILAGYMVREIEQFLDVYGSIDKK